MAYSYTEKKRIRKNFGRLPKIMELPNLIETQLDSYKAFLQRDVDAAGRRLRAAESRESGPAPLRAAAPHRGQSLFHC